MLTIEKILSEENQLKAFEHLSAKKNGAGIDKVPLYEIKEYWSLNKERFEDDIRFGIYKPGIMQEYEIVQGNGKRRTIINMNSIDRFVCRLLSQQLNELLDDTFLPDCYAFRDGKGVQVAIDRVKQYIEDGYQYIVKIDIAKYFDEIDLNCLMEKIKKCDIDNIVLELIKNFLFCTISKNGNLIEKKNGIIQGSAISPVLSNLYLHSFDEYLEDKGYRWVRYADDISVYVQSKKDGAEIFSELTKLLSENYRLRINEYKSGVFSAFERRYLGYDFIKKGNGVHIQRHVYQTKTFHRQWKPTALEKINKEYHIVNEGVLNKKDFAILFENDMEKRNIPVESTEQINVYNEVIITPAFLTLISNERIKVSFCDKYGNSIGYFVPEQYYKDSKVLLLQCEEYLNVKKRLQMAKKMEIAAIHNIRSNIKYYNKKPENSLQNEIAKLSEEIKNLNESKSIEELLLIEGRCRQMYYQAFNKIISDSTFTFSKRTRRPPLDRINALISFGNTLLYNKILQIIWKSQLNPQIGIFHATNKRHYSLNLDFADLFKPIIVDRAIFSLINRRQLRLDSFEEKENGAVYLSPSGKRLFIEAFEEKLNNIITVKGKEYTYKRLIENEISQYQRYLLEDLEYKPYKYY